jgi:hypothetical protein
LQNCLQTIIGIHFKNPSNKPIIARNQVLPKGAMRQEILEQSLLGKEIFIIRDEKSSLCMRILRLWQVYMRNMHSLFALIFRDEGKLIYNCSK